MPLSDGTSAFSGSSNGSTQTRNHQQSGQSGGWWHQGIGGNGQSVGAQNSAFTNALGLYQDWYAPQQAGLQSQANGIFGQIGALTTGYGQQQAALNSQYDAQNAQNQLAIQSLGVDQNAIPRQSQYYDALFGVDREKYNNNMGYNNQLKGFSNQDYKSVVAQLLNQANNINYTADKNIRGINSQATAAGAYTSSGTNESQNDVNADRGFGLEANKQQGIQSSVAHNRELAGIQNTMNNLTSDFKAAGLTHDEQISRLNDRASQLSIQAKQLGLNGQSLSAGLQQGLAKLGIDSALNVGQLMDALNSNNMQQQQIAQQILIHAYQAGLGGN